MRLIFSNENVRLKELADLITSNEFRNFVKKNNKRFSEFKDGEYHFNAEKGVRILEEFLKENDFEIYYDKKEIDKDEFYYVKDIKSDEIVGIFNIRNAIFDNLYLDILDVNKNFVSNSFIIDNWGLRFEKVHNVDWGKYNFSEKGVE